MSVNFDFIICYININIDIMTMTCTSHSTRTNARERAPTKYAQLFEHFESNRMELLADFESLFKFIIKSAICITELLLTG